MLGDEYVVRLATSSDFAEINGVLERSFHPEEMLLQCLLSRADPLDPDDLRLMDEDQRRLVVAMLSSSPCHVATAARGGGLVAASVSITTGPGLRDVYAERPPRSPLLAEYFDRMNGMIEEAGLARRYPGAERMRELYAVAVDRGHRGRGLATALMRQGLEGARDDGVDLLFGLFTSPLSKRAAAKIGLRCVHEIDLTKYRDAEGAAVFEVAGEHSVATVMAVDLRNGNCGAEVQFIG